MIIGLAFGAIVSSLVADISVPNSLYEYTA